MHTLAALSELSPCVSPFPWKRASAFGSGLYPNFFTSVADIDEWSALRSGCFYPGRKFGQLSMRRLGELRSRSGRGGEEKKTISQP
jgi:hypothetical protein